jgi:glycosyltransferase involved in cell wall biosynthesis
MVPSPEEGCSNAVLEAMAAGLPVVAARSAAVCEQVEDGVNGFTVSSTDPREMADRIEFLLKTPESAASLGGAGRRLVRERFSIEKMVHRYSELLQADSALRATI